MLKGKDVLFDNFTKDFHSFNDVFVSFTNFLKLVIKNIIEFFTIVTTTGFP